MLRYAYVLRMRRAVKTDTRYAMKSRNLDQDRVTSNL